MEVPLSFQSPSLLAVELSSLELAEDSSFRRCLPSVTAALGVVV
jgi:hypothetical protein